MKLKKNSGYTVVELLIAISAVGVLAGTIGSIYIAVHFIAKFW